VELAVYPTFVTTRQMVEYLRFGQPWLIAADLDRRVRSAKADGCAVVGLGFAAATLTGYGAGLRVPGIAVTSGGALAIGSALRVLADAADERFGGLGGRTLAVVGGGGTLGCAAAALAADDVSRLVLTGSGGAASTDRLRAAVRRIYQHAWARIAEGGAELTGIPALLAEEPLIGKWVHEGRPAAEPSGAAIAEHLTQRYREDPFIAVGDAKALASAQAVLVAAWGPDPVLEPELLAPDAIVCDLSVPGVVPAGAAGDGRRYLRGGVLTAPGDGVLPPGVRAPLGHGTLFAGAAEAIVLALAEAEDHLAGNDLSGARVRELVELAGKHGFHPVCDQSDLTR
jgi:predicted amino acid dehydrogenase